MNSNNAIYVSVSKLKSSFDHLDVISNNISNSKTVAAKQKQLIYQNYEFQENLKKYDISFVNDVTTYRNKKNGPLESTERPLDVAINGEGYFTVQTQNGIKFSRSGNFTINQDNQLSDFNNNQILDVNNNPILFEQNDNDIMISNKGIISSSNREIAQISIVKFQNDNMLESIGDNLYTTDETPEESIDFTINQFFLEGSNIEPTRELTDLINVQRNTDMVANLVSILENLEQNTIDDLAKTVKG